MTSLRIHYANKARVAIDSGLDELLYTLFLS